MAKSKNNKKKGQPLNDRDLERKASALAASRVRAAAKAEVREAEFKDAMRAIEAYPELAAKAMSSTSRPVSPLLGSMMLRANLVAGQPVAAEASDGEPQAKARMLPSWRMLAAPLLLLAAAVCAHFVEAQSQFHSAPAATHSAAQLP